MSTQQEARQALMSTPTDRGIHIERVFDATVERVWQAVTDPALVAQWWGRGNTVVVERMEVERGGHWRLVEHSDHGTHGFEGRFRRVEPPHLMERTFDWDGMPGHAIVETATFEDLGDGRTKMTVDMLFMTTEERDGMMGSGMEQGMNDSYRALDRVLAEMI